MPLSLSLIARKGGVSKTTTTLNVAGAALEDGAKNVLVIDLDSQASLSKALLGPATVEGLRGSCTVQAVLDGSRLADEVAVATPVPGLRIIPAFPDLTVPLDATLNLSGVEADLIVLDTPPDVRNPGVRAALLASNLVVSPLLPEAWSLQSVSSVQTLLMSAGLVSNRALTFAGWLVVMRQRAAVHDACEDTLRRLHGPQVFSTVIPAAAAFKEAAAAGVPITTYAPKSAAAKATRALWNELLDRASASVERGAA